MTATATLRERHPQVATVTSEYRVVYLASPYSHPDPRVRQARFQAACRAAAALLSAGEIVFSPIAHSHAIAAHGLPTAWEFWECADGELLRRCDELLVLMLPGWQESRGLQAEIAMARELGMPVRYLACTSWDGLLNPL